MNPLPTTAAMIEAAQDAFDVACGDEAVARARYEADRSEASSAKWHVAHAARNYARGVLMATYEDAGRESLSA